MVDVRSNVQEIAVSVCESSTKERKGTYAFTTFEDANKFLTQCANETSMMGGDKNDVLVTWTSGETYKYTTSLSNPLGISRDSVELNIGMRIVDYLLYMLMDESSYAPAKEEKAEMVEFLQSHYFGEFTGEEVLALKAEDEAQKKINKETLRKQYETEAFEELKTELVKAEKPEGGKELTEGVTVKKGAHIVLEGTTNVRNPETGESESLPFRKVYKVGEEANCGFHSDYGEIVSITEKTVTVKSRYNSGNKRLKLANFIYHNNGTQDVQSLIKGKSDGFYVESLIY